MLLSQWTVYLWSYKFLDDFKDMKSTTNGALEQVTGYAAVDLKQKLDVWPQTARKMLSKVFCAQQAVTPMSALESHWGLFYVYCYVDID